MGNSKYCLTKADLADAIYAMLPIDKQKAADIVELYIELIKEALEKDNRMMLSGFGCFEVKAKKARRGRNPQTGEPLILSERKNLKFKASPLLKRALNSHLSDAEYGKDEPEEDE